MSKTKIQDPNLDPLEIARGFMTSRVLLTAVELDVFTTIERGDRTPARLAASLGTDARATERLLNALAGMGLLVKDQHGHFENTEEARRLLVADSEEFVGGALQHYVHLWRSWSSLTEVVKRGKPVRQSDEPWSADSVAAFMAAMDCFARGRAAFIVQQVDLGEAERLLDIGGGPATYAIEFCRRYPRLKATVFDLPQVIPIAAQRIAEAGLTDRIGTRAGNYHVDDFGSGYDIALLFSILHSNSPEQNQALLSKTCDALNPDAQVLILEFLADDSKTRPPFVALFGINMLVNTEKGNVYSEGEIGEWLRDAGFAGIQRLEDVEGVGMLLARKPRGG